MFGMQELFEKQLKEQLKPHKLGALIVAREFNNLGIQLTDEQYKSLESQFDELDKSSFILNFTDEQIAASNITTKRELKKKSEYIFNNLGKFIEEFHDKLDPLMDELINDIVGQIGELIKENLLTTANEMEKQYDEFQNHSFKEITKIWKHPLSLLKGLIVISDEIAQGYIKKFTRRNINTRVQDVLFHAQARSNQIAKEIFLLLNHGFADGALARWRSLHELAVICNFIIEGGEDVAKRYIDYQAIATYNFAKEQNEFSDRLGIEKITYKEMKGIKENYFMLINKYGKKFGGSYGWASDALGLKRVTFKDIEKTVELDHLRPYYKSASQKIHSDPSGVFSSLGTYPEMEVILSGSSHIGLSDPAQLTAITLNQITSSVLTYKPNIDFLVICKVMSALKDDAIREFIAVENNLREQANLYYSHFEDYH